MNQIINSQDDIIKGKCPKCKQVKHLTKHHLFNYFDLKKKLVKIYGKPMSDKEHKDIHKMVLSIHKKIPTEDICRDCHDEIEKQVQPIKLRSLWS